MATIVPFPTKESDSTDSRTLDDICAGPCEILPFTGIRYEREGITAPSGSSGRKAQQRDWLVLGAEKLRKS